MKSTVILLLGLLIMMSSYHAEGKKRKHSSKTDQLKKKEKTEKRKDKLNKKVIDRYIDYAFQDTIEKIEESDKLESQTNLDTITNNNKKTVGLKQVNFTNSFDSNKDNTNQEKSQKKHKKINNNSILMKSNPNMSVAIKKLVSITKEKGITRTNPDNGKTIPKSDNSSLLKEATKALKGMSPKNLTSKLKPKKLPLANQSPISTDQADQSQQGSPVGERYPNFPVPPMIPIPLFYNSGEEEGSTGSGMNDVKAPSKVVSGGESGFEENTIEQDYISGLDEKIIDEIEDFTGDNKNMTNGTKNDIKTQTSQIKCLTSCHKSCPSLCCRANISKIHDKDVHIATLAAENAANKMKAIAFKIYNVKDNGNLQLKPFTPMPHEKPLKQAPSIDVGKYFPSVIPSQIPHLQQPIQQLNNNGFISQMQQQKTQQQNIQSNNGLQSPTQSLINSPQSQMQYNAEGQAQIQAPFNNIATPSVGSSAPNDFLNQQVPQQTADLQQPKIESPESAMQISYANAPSDTNTNKESDTPTNTHSEMIAKVPSDNALSTPTNTVENSPSNAGSSLPTINHLNAPYAVGTPAEAVANSYNTADPASNNENPPLDHDLQEASQRLPPGTTLQLPDFIIGNDHHGDTKDHTAEDLKENTHKTASLNTHHSNEITNEVEETPESNTEYAYAEPELPPTMKYQKQHELMLPQPEQDQLAQATSTDHQPEQQHQLAFPGQTQEQQSQITGNEQESISTETQSPNSDEGNQMQGTQISSAEHSLLGNYDQEGKQSPLDQLLTAVPSESEQVQHQPQETDSTSNYATETAGVSSQSGITDQAGVSEGSQVEQSQSNYGETDAASSLLGIDSKEVMHGNNVQPFSKDLFSEQTKCLKLCSSKCLPFCSNYCCGIQKRSFIFFNYRR